MPARIGVGNLMIALGTSAGVGVAALALAAGDAARAAGDAARPEPSAMLDIREGAAAAAAAAARPDVTLEKSAVTSPAS